MMSEPIFLIINLTIVTFISSSLDNLLLLIGFMGNYSSYKREVVIGYLMDIFIVNIVALVFSYWLGIFPIHFLKYLGIIPISLGIYQILQIFNRSSTNESVKQLDVSKSKIKIILTVCGIMLANSGDTLAVFLAFMTDTQQGLRWLVLVTSLFMGVLWGIIARIFLSSSRLKSLIEPISKYVLPFVLIFIGWYILTDSSTDTEALIQQFNNYAYF
ncbi:hypothetical protein C7H19_00285 [Aphanothece hegewaldii CCALA 016]|uniref:Transporter n=1 Tax=Aphanothece hegewaldii CCALA 016 TaxID=2107694 RepID=A0A2T1M344_9CHRO|nr:cadmium resistance transporter [Aphanothece hegewaldii]PSF39264.1 hypothetical protein C7H19_00285 [Aphanothece hegewaldii CCALA 016]